MNEEKSICSSVFKDNSYWKMTSQFFLDWSYLLLQYTLFYKQCFFPTQHHCCLFFNELSLKFCLSVANYIEAISAWCCLWKCCLYKNHVLLNFDIGILFSLFYFARRKRRKNFLTAEEHIFQKVLEGFCLDLLRWTWEPISCHWSLSIHYIHKSSRSAPDQQCLYQGFLIHFIVLDSFYTPLGFWWIQG